MLKKDIIALYREWRKENGNKKPNRVIVKMHWEDDPENILVDTVGWEEDDAYVLFYAGAFHGWLDLTKTNNGSDFILDEVLEFYKK